MTTIIPKPLQTTELVYGDTDGLNGVAALHHPVRLIVADETTESTDSIIQVATLNAAGATPRTVTISNSNRIIPGFAVIVADVTGITSSAQPIAIVREDGGLIQGNIALVISAPYGSVSLWSDGTDIWITPHRDSQIFSPPTTFRRELELNGGTSDREFVILPTDPVLADTITLFYNSTNAAPYVICSGTGTATISRMVFKGQNTVDEVTTVPDSGSLAVAASAVYFSSDGTGGNAFGLSAVNASARVIFRIEGFGTALMTPQIVEINLLSGGLDGGLPLVSIWGEFLPASYLETD